MEFYLIIILKLITLCILGGICGLLGYFLDYCFQEHSVFQKYLPWLAKTLVRSQKPSDYKEVMMLKPELRDYEFITRALGIFHYKMLGGCSICFNVWLSATGFILLNLGLSFGWFYLPVFTLTSHLVLRKLMKV